MKKKSLIKDWLKALLLAFVLVLVLRVFFFETFTIPSASMEKSLLTGDYVLVNKFTYGSRLPNTPIAFPFVHQQLPFTEETKSYLDWIKIPYTRLFGSANIQHNDVVVFNYPQEEEHPVDQRTFYVKRCVAVAGDTLEIKEGQIYINGKYNDEPQKLQFNYKVLTDGDSLDINSLQQSGIVEGGRMSKKGEYWLTLNLENVERIKKYPKVKDVQVLLEKKGHYSDYMFPDNEHFLWNVDFFGPIYIPKAGDSVHLSIDSLPLYDRIISVYENNTLEVSNDSIFINNEYKTSYTFKMNYYFMMGDNRHSSADSRFWGFVPEDHIVGKAVSILMSIDKSEEENSIRWDRWFKAVE